MADFTPIATMVKGPSIDPAQVTGLVNMGRVSQQFQKEQELLPYEIAMGKAQSNTAELENLYKHQAASTRDLLKLLNKSDPVTPSDIENHVKTTMANAGAPEKAIKQALMDLPKAGSDKELRAFVAKHATNSLTAESQLEKLFPSAQATNVGGAIVPMAGGGPLAYTAPGTQVGPATATTISPQVTTDPITGRPVVIGGGRAPGTQPTGGGFSLAPQGGPQVAPQAAPTPPAQAPAAPAMNAPAGSQGAPAGGGVTQRSMSMPSGGQLQQLPNESPANFNARVAQTQGAVAKAQDQFSNPNSEFGHIPTVKTINNNILGLLKDPSVNTGSVQSYIAGKIRQENLSAKEQELAKYLAQRVQNLTPKSDADAESKRKAYGSLELKKEALIDLIRQDNAWVTTQELQAKGVLNNGGDPTNPNFGRVAQFNNQFAKLAQNPALMKYIGIVGESQGKVSLDADDLKALQKELGSMKPEARQALELQRQTLLKLVNGGQ